MKAVIAVLLALAVAGPFLLAAGQGEEGPLPFAVGAAPAGCDVGAGEWVRDDDARPMYQEWECPYIQPQHTCQAHGRPDKAYQSWRWQPSGCSMPSFNATLMLEQLRGKRMLFVGDSLNRAQYISLVCLLQRAIPNDGAKSFETVDALSIFRARDYDATVEFYWAPMLAESISDSDPDADDRLIRGAPMDRHSSFWKGADVLVFHSYLWWASAADNKIQILKGADNDPSKDIVEMKAEEAYRLVLYQVVRWLERSVDARKSRVFFVTASPSHTDDSCYNQTTPIDGEYRGSATTATRREMERVTEEVLATSRVPVALVNVTRLSEYRRDAHTQTYGKGWEEPTAEQRADPGRYADCTHWCLPGVPDTWNEMLYWKLFFPSNDQFL